MPEPWHSTPVISDLLLLKREFSKREAVT